MLRLRTHLVTISPEVVLGSDVHVGILGTLFDRRLMRLVFPVLRPQPIGIDASNAEGRDDDAAKVSYVSIHASERCWVDV